MRAVIQRTDESSVNIDDKVISSIDRGLTVLLGIGREDNMQDVKYLADKIVNLRIFPDDNGKMNLSLSDIKGELLVISQFTLYGDCRKGRRPSFDESASPEAANELYNQFLAYCSNNGITVASGRFQSDMIVRLSNNGPVTILLDSKRLF